MSKGGASIKTVIVLVILVLVGVLGVLGVNTVRTYMSGASAGAEPKNVLAVSGIDGKTAVITWTSDKPAQGIVEYGLGPASLLLRELEADPVSSHKVTLKLLKPTTSYYFRIRVGEEVFDNSGIPYSFKTVAGEGGDVVVKPSVRPEVTTVPVVATPAVGTGSGKLCNRATDYDGNGVINSVDFIKCIKDGGKVEVVPTRSAIPTVVTDCKTNVDYDGNGVINSLDRIKCLQKGI
jgi:hypothetical protein